MEFSPIEIIGIIVFIIYFFYKKTEAIDMENKIKRLEENTKKYNEIISELKSENEIQFNMLNEKIINENKLLNENAIQKNKLKDHEIKENEIESELENNKTALAESIEKLRNSEMHEQEIINEYRTKINELTKLRLSEVEKAKKLAKIIVDDAKSIKSAQLQELEEIIANQINKIEAREKDLYNNESQFITMKNTQLKEIESYKNDIDKITSQRKMAFPWLIKAFDDYKRIKDRKLEKELEKRPAQKAADEVRIAHKETREAERHMRESEYKVAMYESLYPWLKELISDQEEDEPVEYSASFKFTNEEKKDLVTKWLEPEEYRNLQPAERNQLALDRYLQSHHKSKWKIGRDYERYIGWLWEQDGYLVKYTGALDGFEDMGRDLIASKEGKIAIIQCKYWSSKKTIHEKHIFQLFGTAMEYWLELDSNNNTVDMFFEKVKEKSVVPVFYTKTTISEVAKSVANALHVEIHENEVIKDYPRIKCNIAGHDKEKIYHLPFDQQYDKVVIENENGEFYAWTAEEAESKGFRRAFKWHGNGQKSL